MNSTNRFPTFYISHGGGPCFFMDWSPMGDPDTWKKMEQWLRDFKNLLPRRPKAIVVVSAHWEEANVTIQQVSNPPLIFDYYGFPPHTYLLKYPAPGAPDLAAKIQSLLNHAGIESKIDASRGFDHGVFIPLLLMFPEADIPILQVSLKSNLDPKEHLELGKALAPLREEDVLILGSGMSYHNLRALFSRAETAAGSDEFDLWLTQAVTANDPSVRNNRLSQWKEAPAARLAHPREEHLIPLMVIAGAAGQDLGRLSFCDKIMGAKNSSYSFS